MFFSKDGINFVNFNINGKTFTQALRTAAKSLRIESGHKVYYKENEENKPLLLVYKE